MKLFLIKAAVTCLAKASDQFSVYILLTYHSPAFHIGGLTSFDLLATHSWCLFASLSLSTALKFGVSLGSPQVILSIFMVSNTTYVLMRLKFPSLVLIFLLLSSRFL